MNKVAWARAPEWANWYTEDEGGGTFWLEEPEWDEVSCVFIPVNRGPRYLEVFVDNCSKHIEKRPTEGDTE